MTETVQTPLLELAIGATFYGLSFDPWRDPEHNQWYACVQIGDDGTTRHVNPEPISTELSAAVEFVQTKLRRLWCVSIQTVEDESTNRWYVTLDPLHSQRHKVPQGRGWAETLPLAIARAAFSATTDPGVVADVRHFFKQKEQ